jgi:hypothetical protein
MIVEQSVPTYSVINEFPILASPLATEPVEPPTYTDVIKNYQGHRPLKSTITTRNLQPGHTSSNYDSIRNRPIDDIITDEVERRLRQHFPVFFSVMIVKIMFLVSVASLIVAVIDADEVMSVVLILSAAESCIGLLSSLFIIILSMLWIR